MAWRQQQSIEKILSTLTQELRGGSRWGWSRTRTGRHGGGKAGGGEGGGQTDLTTALMEDHIQEMQRTITAMKQQIEGLKD